MDYLVTWVDAFMMDRKVQNMAKGALHYYRFRLREFVGYYETRDVKSIAQIDPNLLREYMLLRIESCKYRARENDD